MKEDKMKQKIKSITEAFSMQPMSFSVCTAEIVYSRFPNNDRKHEHSNECVITIELEEKAINTGMPDKCVFQVYRGYNKNNEMLFEYFANSVNVQYFLTE